jgi:two-component system response regulator AtoC
MDYEPLSGQVRGLTGIGQRLRVLIAGGDDRINRALSGALARRNCELRSATSVDDTLKAFRLFAPHLVVLSSDSLVALEGIKEANPEVAVLVLAAGSDADTIFRASKMGADDFLSLPLNPAEVEGKLQRLLGPAGETQVAAKPRENRRPDFAMLFGTSPKMEDVKLTIEKVADTNATVLIRGESGTGKEMVARMVYAQSGRRERPFVKVNCAAIPYELLESELFGYEQGAFTGASRQKLGKFDQANNGTIFLDEISEMHPALQAKLLHVLQDGEFSRLGGKRDIAVDVRVLAATNKPLERAVSQGQFREDLFYRLNVVTIHIPPLRERREEVPVFLEFFLAKYSDYYGKQPPAFSQKAIAAIMDYSWPGNIRELENLVKRYTIVGNEGQILRELATHKPIVTSGGNDSYAPEGAAAKPAAARIADNEQPSLLEIGRRAAMKAEREAIERVLTQTKWNRRQAAKILKISYKALLNKLKLIEVEQQAESGQRSA